MNIKQAKEYIKDSVKIYLKKDAYGEYIIPVVRQRPIFLLGAPGVGKTAIMEQVAQELGIAVVSYSMTHHTRQSALGLPFISHKEYAGQSFDVSEYTMSEIIASVYEVMEKSGIREGILFLDEINCVSETLAPSMLQFLQYKIFGRHQVPEGWVIVTAGNPPEYNKSVREFDVVTMDRLKILEVTADYEAWREYAKERKLHGAIINYLDMKKEDFYCIETTVKGRSYVTARGWEDLSQIIRLYEEEGLVVDENLVEQYLRNDRIVKEFTAYYDLYNKYKNDYKIQDILNGNATEQARDKARKAGFDERLSLMGLLIDRVQNDIEQIIMGSTVLQELLPSLKIMKTTDKELSQMLDLQIEARKKTIETMQVAGTLSSQDKRKLQSMIRFLENCKKTIRVSEANDNAAAFAVIKAQFDAEKAQLQEQVKKEKETLHHLFGFVNDSFGEGNEMLLLLTELTVNAHCTKFIAMFGCDDYQQFNQKMMLSERQNELLDEINLLEI